MSNFKVRIETLPAMRTAVFRGYGTAPEMEAYTLAAAFAEEKKLVNEEKRMRTFGFNKPSPWVTSDDEYGYEIWVVIGDDLDIPKYIMTKRFPGTECAVTSIDKLADIGEAWHYLYRWVGENQDFEHAQMDGLEEVVSPLGTAEEEFAFNLYLPVIEMNRG